jgi:hypothetical protein
MASRFSIEAIFTAIDKMSAPIKNMTLQNKKFMKTIKTDFAKAQRSVMKFGENFKRNLGQGIKIGAGLAVAGIGLFIKEGLRLASDLVEVDNVVRQTFGEDGTKRINDWSKTALEAFGLSELQAKEFTGTMGAMIKASGISGDMLQEMSTNLVGLSGDVASFRNLKPEEAFQKFQSIVTGSTEPLRSLGINMTVANLSAFAMSKGINKSWKEMSQAEQVMLRYQFVMEKTADMQGDFKRTSAEFANQQRLLTVNFQQFAAKVVSKVLPVFNTLITSANKFIKSLDAEKIGNNLKRIFGILSKVITIFVKFFKIIKPFAPFIFGIIAAWLAYATAMKVAAIAQIAFNIAMTANPIGIVIVAIGILIGLIILIVKNWDLITAAIVKFTKATINWFKELLNKSLEFFDKFSGIGLLIAAPFVMILSIQKSLLQNWNNITDAFKSGGIKAGILAIGKAMLDGLLVPIQSFLELVSKIPGVGNLAKGGALKIGQLRENLLKETQDIGPTTPSERSSLIREERTEKSELTIRDQTGRADLQSNPNNRNMKLVLDSSGGF